MAGLRRCRGAQGTEGHRGPLLGMGPGDAVVSPLVLLQPGARGLEGRHGTFWWGIKALGRLGNRAVPAGQILTPTEVSAWLLTQGTGAKGAPSALTLPMAITHPHLVPLWD